jgi:hypothetical protein
MVLAPAFFIMSFPTNTGPTSANLYTVFEFFVRRKSPRLIFVKLTTKTKNSWMDSRSYITSASLLVYILSAHPFILYFTWLRRLFVLDLGDVHHSGHLSGRSGIWVRKSNSTQTHLPIWLSEDFAVPKPTL